MDENKMIEAAELLKEHCLSIESIHCIDCVLYAKNRGECLVYWNIPRPRRWTDADIALAKALKAFGVYKVGRVSNGGIRAYTVSPTGGCGVPKGAFAALKQGEEASLNEILEEGEEQ